MISILPEIKEIKCLCPLQTWKNKNFSWHAWNAAMSDLFLVIHEKDWFYYW
jgi:hypothetical protein